MPGIVLLLPQFALTRIHHQSITTVCRVNVTSPASCRMGGHGNFAMCSQEMKTYRERLRDLAYCRFSVVFSFEIASLTTWDLLEFPDWLGAVSMELSVRSGCFARQLGGSVSLRPAIGGPAFVAQAKWKKSSLVSTSFTSQQHVRLQVLCRVTQDVSQEVVDGDTNVKRLEERRVDNDGFTRSKMAVFVSGGGSNFRAIHAGCVSNQIYGDIAVVVSDKPGEFLTLFVFLWWNDDFAPLWLLWMFVVLHFAVCFHFQLE